MSQRRPISVIVFAGVVCAMAPLACRSSIDVTARDECEEGFGGQGETGCFEATGIVVDTAGKPLGGMLVTFRFVEGSGAYNGPDFKLSETDGRFRIRAWRQFRVGPARNPDTASVFVAAVDLHSAPVGATPVVRDSVLTQFTIAKPGTTPTAADVRLVLKTP